MSLALILYFIILFKSFILLIKHYFVDQRTITELEEKQSQLEKGYFNVRSNRQTSREKISHIGEALPDNFLRIHRSFIVNRNKISSYSREYVQIGELELPISRTYRKQVVSRL